MKSFDQCCETLTTVLPLEARELRALLSARHDIDWKHSSSQVQFAELLARELELNRFDSLRADIAKNRATHEALQPCVAHIFEALRARREPPSLACNLLFEAIYSHARVYGNPHEWVLRWTGWFELQPLRLSAAPSNYLCAAFAFDRRSAAQHLDRLNTLWVDFRDYASLKADSPMEASRLDYLSRDLCGALAAGASAFFAMLEGHASAAHRLDFQRSVSRAVETDQLDCIVRFAEMWVMNALGHLSRAERRFLEDALGEFLQTYPAYFDHEPFELERVRLFGFEVHEPERGVLAATRLIEADRALGYMRSAGQTLSYFLRVLMSRGAFAEAQSLIEKYANDLPVGEGDAVDVIPLARALTLHATGNLAAAETQYSQITQATDTSQFWLLGAMAKLGLIILNSEKNPIEARRLWLEFEALSGVAHEVLWFLEPLLDLLLETPERAQDFSEPNAVRLRQALAKHIPDDLDVDVRILHSLVAARSIFGKKRARRQRKILRTPEGQFLFQGVNDENRWELQSVALSPTAEKVISLLFARLAMGSPNLPRDETLFRHLWPELDLPDKAELKRQLRFALRRVRISEVGAWLDIQPTFVRLRKGVVHEQL